MSKKSTVSLPNDTDVVVIRDFAAPRTLVFEAWTKPELMRRWLLGPPGWSMPVCEMDARTGGKFRWRWRNDETGAEFGFSGEFREVVRPTRIVHVERYDPGSMGGEMGEALVTTEFAEANGVTTQKTTISYASKAVRDAALKTGMTNGMEMGYERLDALLAAGGV